MSDTLSLIFSWPVRNAVRLALPVLLLISIVIHLVGLMVFQLKPLQETRLPPQAAMVYVLPPEGNPLLANVLPRIAASDPALFSPAVSEERGLWRLPSSDYEPSFDSRSLGLAPLPAQFPAANPLVMETGPTRRLSGPPLHPAPTAPIPTTVAFEGGLSQWKFSLPPTIMFSAPTRQNLVPLEFLVAIEPSGRVLHAIPLTTSGYAPLDRQATQALMSGQVAAPSGLSSEPVWGSATFLWGGDVLRQPTQ